MDQLVRVISAAFGLLAFAVATLAGLRAGNPATDVLITSLISAFLGRIIGTIAGTVLAHVVQQHLNHYKLDHPVPELLTTGPVMEVSPEDDASTGSNSSSTS